MSKLLEYKGYHAKPEFSVQDGCFVGELLFIDDIVAFEGKDEEEAIQSFHNSVDEYIDFCKEVGKLPK